MQCPKCFHDDTTPVGSSHYVCNNQECTINGGRTQFRVIQDEKIEFPYNQIFVNRSPSEFVRKSYLEIKPIVRKK